MAWLIEISAGFRVAERHKRRFCNGAGWLVIAAVLAAVAPLRAQNMVVNGEFANGEIEGWVLSPGGQVSGQVDGQTWIRLDGELYQDLTTKPGQDYVLSFRVQGWDPALASGTRSLRAYWEGQMVAAYDFAPPDGGWRQPYVVLSATNATTRLRFVGSAGPSLDAVSVVPAPAGIPVFRILQPVAGAELAEGENAVVVVANQDAAAGAAVAVRVWRNGAVLLGSAAGDPWEFVWENPPAGTYCLSAEVVLPGWVVLNTVPVAVTVRARPEVRLELPRSHALFAPGQEIEMQARVIDNDGAMDRVVYLANGAEVGQENAPLGEATLWLNWLAPAEGNYRLAVRGEGADGTLVSLDERTVHVLPAGLDDQVQTVGGSWIRTTPGAPIAQVFTAGRNARLRQVELLGDMNDHDPDTLQTSLTATIVAAEDGLPGTNVLGVGVWTFGEVQQPLTNGLLATVFSFPSNRVGLVAGRQYALVVATEAASGICLGSSPEDRYGGGSLFQWVDGAWQVDGGSLPSPASDLVFRTVVIPNDAPTVSLTSPTALTAFAAGTNVVLEATATDPDGQVVGVEFHADDQMLGTVTEPPYVMAWTNVPMGNPILSARAVDDLGAVGVSPPVSVAVGLPADLPRVRITDAHASEAQAPSHALVFTATLSEPTNAPVTLQYKTSDGTAKAGEDYDAASGTLTFGPGVTEAAIPVVLRPDLLNESHEYFFLNLRYPSGALIETPQAVGTVVDDEPGPGKVASFVWQLGSTLQTVLSPFPVTLEARDPEGNVASNIVGTVELSVVTAAGTVLTNRVTPQQLEASVSGVWTQELVLRLIGEGFVLRATDEFGHWGLSPVLQVGSASGDDVPLMATEMALLTNVSAQTGLFCQRVRIENLGTETVPAFVAAVTNLPSPIRVLGTRMDTAGQSWLWQPSPLLPGESVEWHIEYYDSTRLGAFSPQLRFSLDVPEFVEPTGPEMQVRRALPLSEGAILVEFDAPKGYVVWVEYGPDLEEWRTAGGPVTGNGQRVLWLDQGPPKTAVHPAEDGQRYYRLRLAEH